MPRPASTSAISRALLLLTLVATGTAGALGIKPVRKAVASPNVRIPLSDLGYTPVPARLLLSGSTSLTVHFVDDTHLLVTFYVHRLMKRMVDDPPDDLDRTVAAVLLEIPSGKVLARTEWRLHDPSQYLWPLSHGRFLLRIQDTLSFLSPLQNLATGDAFQTRTFLHTHRRISALLISPEADLLILQTRVPPPPAPEIPANSVTTPTNAQAAAALGLALPSAAGAPSSASAGRTSASQKTDPRAVQVRFYRLSRAKGEGGEDYKFAGGTYAPALIELIGNSAGVMQVTRESTRRFLFDFVPFAGKKMELSPFDSSCPPEPYLVARGEFVAIGCRDAATDLNLGGFNLRGEQLWQKTLPAGLGLPWFATSPTSGRFALSITPPDIPLAEVVPPDPANRSIATQDVRVLQAQDGRELLRAQVSPVQKSGHNFALSPSGLDLAVIHDGSIEVHTLPPLTEVDEKEMHADAAVAPPDTQATIRLSIIHSGSGPLLVTEDLPEEEQVLEPPPDGPAAPAKAEAVTAPLASPRPAETPASLTAGSANAIRPSSPDAAATPPPPKVLDTPPSSAPEEPDQPRRAPTLFQPGEKPSAPPH